MGEEDPEEDSKSLKDDLDMLLNGRNIIRRSIMLRNGAFSVGTMLKLRSLSARKE